jgi:hypothetical protein
VAGGLVLQRVRVCDARDRKRTRFTAAVVVDRDGITIRPRKGTHPAERIPWLRVCEVEVVELKPERRLTVTRILLLGPVSVFLPQRRPRSGVTLSVKDGVVTLVVSGWPPHALSELFAAQRLLAGRSE